MRARSGSDLEKFPFGILQKLHHERDRFSKNISQGRCMKCGSLLKKVNAYYCSSYCTNSMKRYRELGGTWKN